MQKIEVEDEDCKVEQGGNGMSKRSFRLFGRLNNAYRNVGKTMGSVIGKIREKKLVKKLGMTAQNMGFRRSRTTPTDQR